MQVRIQKFIADAGLTSRRKAERLVREGRVCLNGRLVSVLGTKVNPHEDVVFVDGRNVEMGHVEKIYILLNRPRGYVTTAHDPEGRKTVMDLIPRIPERVYPVGRLDYQSEGLLLLTNDGPLAHRVMHPSGEVVKVYEVKVLGIVTRTLLKKLRGGITVDKKLILPKSVRVIGELRDKTWLEFRLGEGKNREIRKLCSYCGLEVGKLRRVAVGGLNIEGIPLGQCRFLSRTQIYKALEMAEYRSAKKSLTPR